MPAGGTSNRAVIYKQSHRGSATVPLKCALIGGAENDIRQIARATSPPSGDCGRVHTTKSNQTRGNRPATRVSSARLADGWHVSSTRHMSEYKHSLTFRVRRCVVIATKSVHRLQIRPIVRNITGILYHSLKLRPGPCMRRGTDRQTHTHTHTHTHRRS